MTKLTSCTCTSHSRTVQGEVKYNKRHFEAHDGLSLGWTSDGGVIPTHLDFEKHSDLGKRSGFMKDATVNKSCSSSFNSNLYTMYGNPCFYVDILSLGVNALRCLKVISQLENLSGNLFDIVHAHNH